MSSRPRAAAIAVVRAPILAVVVMLLAGCDLILGLSSVEPAVDASSDGPRPVDARVDAPSSEGDQPDATVDAACGQRGSCRNGSAYDGCGALIDACAGTTVCCDNGFTVSCIDGSTSCRDT